VEGNSNETVNISCKGKIFSHRSADFVRFDDIGTIRQCTRSYDAD
jgi:hypothetical protein